MRVIGHGIDAVDVARIADAIRRHGDRFLDRCFTRDELEYAARSRRRHEHLAARFAAKEAALKALGTGWSRGIAWTDVSVIRAPSGAPQLRVGGRAGAVARDLGVDAWYVSLSHTSAIAVASVIAAGSDQPV